MSTTTTTATSTPQFPAEQGKTVETIGKLGGEPFNVQLPDGRTVTFQLPSGHPADIPGARTTQWTMIPEERLPTDLPSAPPGFRVAQYEREIEIDLANLNLKPVTYTSIPVVTTVCEPIKSEFFTCAPIRAEPCKPEVKVETTTTPPCRVETQRKEFAGGEEYVSTGEHGEKVTTKITQLPSGGERIETKTMNPFTERAAREDITTRTSFKECGGGTTTVESHTKFVPPEKTVITEDVGHHHDVPRQGKLGHHHHDTSIGGLLKGAFGLRHGEHEPKETM
jgi:hypothetical protein